MDNQLNFFANASLSAESSTDWPRWEMKPIAAHFEDGKCRGRNLLKRLQKALKQGHKRRSRPLVTLCWSAGLRTLERM